MLQSTCNKRTIMVQLIAIFHILVIFIAESFAQDIVGCGGFVQSSVPLNFERVEVKLYTKQGALKFKTECAPNNGYFLVAVYDKVSPKSFDDESQLFLHGKMLQENISKLEGLQLAKECEDLSCNICTADIFVIFCEELIQITGQMKQKLCAHAQKLISLSHLIPCDRPHD